jgi:hypothetical protein
MRAVRASLDHFAYFETQTPGGLMAEIAQALISSVRTIFDSVA